MKKIFFVGDFISNTGPAIVNKEIKKQLGNKEFVYSEACGKISRIFELFFKIIICKKVCFCSFSQINKLGIILCKIFRKDSFYIMHGYLKREYEINSIDNISKLNLEDYILNNVKMTICVSKSAMNYVIKTSDYKCKFSYFYNNINKPFKVRSHINNNVVMSTGGLVPLKNNIVVCEAIDFINKNYDLNLKYIILGNSFNSLNLLDKYDFVEFHNTLPHDECLKLMHNCNLYIQNSEFETFGLSVVEALSCGCSILISKNVGSIDILNNINDDSIINDTHNIYEISNKIVKLLSNPNNDLLNRINFDKYTADEQASRLVKLIMNEVCENE